MHSKETISIIFLILILTIPGCSSDGCYEDIDSDVFISLNTTEDEDNVSIDSLTVFGLGVLNDSLYQDATEENLLLPLYPGSDHSIFVILNGLVSDTITINYSSSYNFVSKGCGYNYLHTIESVSFTRNRIDTILIINNSVTPDDEENLRTFF